MPWNQSAFNQRLVAQIHARNKTKKEIAAVLKVSPVTVSRWGTSASHTPSLNTIIELSEALACDPGALAFGDKITSEEAELVTYFRHATQAQRRALLALLKEIQC